MSRHNYHPRRYNSVSNDVELANCNETRMGSYSRRYSRQSIRVRTDEASASNVTRFLHKRGHFGREELSLKCTEGDKVLDFGKAIRQDDRTEVLRFIEENGEMFGKVTFKFEITVEKIHQDGDEDDEDAEDEDTEKATLEVNALHLAIMAQHTSIVELLIKEAQRLDASRSENAGLTSVCYKILRDNVSIKFRQTDLKNYFMSEQMMEDMNAFHVAAKYHPASLLLLLELWQAKETEYLINSQTRHLLQTPLFIAARYSNVHCVRALIQNGADIKIRDIRGLTPLHTAVKADLEMNAIVLLETGSDPNATGKGGMTPLHRARSAGMVRILLEYRADPYATWTLDGGCEEASTFNTLLNRNPEAAEEIFSNGIGDNGREISSNNYLITYDLELFKRETESSQKSEILYRGTEMAVHSKLIGNKRVKTLLKNPLALAFLHLKTTMVRRIFIYVMAIYFCATFISFTFISSIPDIIVSCAHNHTLNITAANSSYVMENSTAEYGGETDFFNISKDMITLSFCREYDPQVERRVLFQLFTFLVYVGLVAFARLYPFSMRSFLLQRRENILEFIVIVLVFVYYWLLYYTLYYAQFLGICVIFLITVSMITQMSKYPEVGKYIEMVVQVVKLLFKAFVAYAPFLVAFGYNFHLLMKNVNRSFSNPFHLTNKVMVMMMGEFDYDESFGLAVFDYGNQKTLFVIVQAIFAVFMILITITLSNLILGLSVHKTDELQREIDIICLKKRVKLLIGMESSLGGSRTFAKFFSNLDEKASKICIRLSDEAPYSVFIYNETKSCEGLRLSRFYLPEKIVQQSLEILTRRKKMMRNSDLTGSPLLEKWMKDIETSTILDTSFSH